MAVAVEIDRSPAHVPPGSERVVAKHELLSIDGEFRIWLHALPTGATCYGRTVVVTEDEVFSAMQRLQQMGNPLRRLAYGEVAEVPDFIPDRQG